MILFGTYVLDTLLIMGLYALTCAFYIFLKSIDRSKVADRDLPFVSILVPARNEEGKIERCLASLLAQDYPSFELIVIDDRSTDRTGEIIEEFAKRDSRVKYVKGKDAPAGWIGKCNALAHAVGYASGDWFVFTDADTYHHVNSIRDSVSYAMNKKVDLISFVPMQELGSFPERLFMPVLLSSFLIGDPFHTVNDPRAERAYAYGQYILCRRSSYLAVGGHQSVRDEIVEDHAIARVFKEKGYKIWVGDGKTLYSVRMYTGLKTLWHGWSKNLYSLIDSKVFNLTLILILINSVVLLPFIEAGYVSWMWLYGDNDVHLLQMTVFSCIQFMILMLWFKRTSEHHAGVKWYHFFLLPFGSMAVTCLYLHAAYLVLFGGQVNWKGRRYVVNTHKTIKSDEASTIGDAALAQDD